MTRRRIVAGNWKMYKTVRDSIEYVESFVPAIDQRTCDVYLAVPYTAIQGASEACRGSGICVGAQNMNDCQEGAFTGEIAGQMLKDVGAEFVILGHSERRLFFGESSAFVNRKVRRALEEKIEAVLCVGETLEQREAGLVAETLKQQLSESLEGLSAEELQTMVLAYEPVWAVGTGKTATPEIAQETHQMLRNFIAEQWGAETAEKLPILYGGSVKPGNASVLMGQADIDGVLVGGASLSVETFVHIVLAEPEDVLASAEHD